MSEDGINYNHLRTLLETNRVDPVEIGLVTGLLSEEKWMTTTCECGHQMRLHKMEGGTEW
jgi:hypothetical protein